MKNLLLALIVLLTLNGCLGITAPDPLFDCDVLWEDHNQVIPPNDSIFVEVLLLENGRVSYDTTIVNNTDYVKIIADPTDFKNKATECPE